MPDPARWTETEMLILASRALGRIDRDGRRGTTRVTLDEIEAMAGLLACFGLVPTRPGAPRPLLLLTTPERPPEQPDEEDDDDQ